MKAGRPLRRRTPLKSRSEKKQREVYLDALRVREEGPAFKAVIAGERCVRCGRTRAEAIRDSGFGHQAHHVISQERLKKLGLRHRLWDPRNAACMCEEPCHRRVKGREPLKKSEVPRRVHGFVREVLAEDGIDLSLYLPDE